jgi:hypothetical protein
MNKTELLAGLRAENKAWEALLDQIGQARMDQPGVTGSWSIKDIVAHLAGWRRRTVARLQAASEAGQDPRSHGEAERSLPWPAHLQTDDEINAWLYDTNRNRPIHEVLDDSRQVFQQLAAAIESFPEAELMDPGRFHWMEGEPLSPAVFFAHFHHEHEPDMRAWLAKQAPR